MPTTVQALPAQVASYQLWRARSAGQPIAAKRTRINFADISALLIGLAGSVEVPLLGRLFGADIALMIALPFLLANQGKRLTGVWPTRVILFGLFWLAAQIATDLIRGSSPDDYLRGWAKISFLLINFAACYLLLNTNLRLILFILGVACSTVIHSFIYPDPAQIGEPWKFLYSWPVTTSLVIAANLAYNQGRRPLAYLLLSTGCVLSFYLNYRSLALICFATLSCLLFSSKQTRKQQPLKLAAIALALAALSWGFGRLYETIVQTGALGQDALEKYEFQSSGEGGILLGGRTESLSSMAAISDSPLIGHGSWARDAYYSEIQKNKLVELGYRLPYSPDDLIPTHSHLLGAWVEAGVVGAIFWLLIIYLCIKSIALILTTQTPLRVCGLFLAVALLWDIPFSPFGADRRFSEPAFFTLLIAVTRFAYAAKKRKRAGAPSIASRSAYSN